MNLLVAINKNYIEQLKILLKSIQTSNPKEVFSIYILHKNLEKNDITNITTVLNQKQMHLHPIQIPTSEVDSFPVYEKRYPIEIYFRIFAPKYLPKNLNRILYLDTDTIVINNLKEFYNMDFENNYFIATTHIQKLLHKFHEIRLGLASNYPYINTGVLLMNLKELRKIPIEKEVIHFVRKNEKKLMLPDQDIISTLYGNRIKLVENLKYNLGERSWKLHNLNHPKEKITIGWIRKNTVIIHYYGRNKPWNKNYIGKLDNFYKEMAEETLKTK